MEVIILSEDDEVPNEPAVEAPGEPEEDDPEEDPEEEYMPEEYVPEEYVPEEAYVPGAEMLEVDNDPEPEEGSLWSELTDLGGDYAEPPQGMYERGEASRGHDLPNLCSLCSYYEATHGDLCCECDAFITKTLIQRTYASRRPGETAVDPVIISDDD